MAGHSKWKQIKYKKAITDSKRAKSFTKIIKEITIAARSGGGDPTGNPRLRFLLDKAKDVNMPQENYTRAIKKGTGELPGMSYEAITYEGYGPNGIAVIIEVLTDNKNRAIADLRALANRKGGIIAESGSVSWMFDRAGVIHASGKKMSEDELLEHLIDFDVNDIKEEEGTFIITTAPKALESVKQAIAELGFKIDEAELEWVAKTPVHLSGEAEEKALEFLEAVEDLEDVQNVFTTLE